MPFPAATRPERRRSRRPGRSPLGAPVGPKPARARMGAPSPPKSHTIMLRTAGAGGVSRRRLAGADRMVPTTRSLP